jgi:hypothetical protein
MVLAADLADATGDAKTAARWARGVAALWKSADPPLQAEVTRMKAMASGGSTTPP